MLGLSQNMPVAADVNGFIQFQSTNGDDFAVGTNASITITDITPGFCQRLGFGAVTTATARGINKGTRGIITESFDGLGGRVPLRYLAGQDGSNPVVTQPDRLIFTGSSYTPSINGGQLIFARLKQNPAVPSWILSYQTAGLVRPQLTTSMSRFTTLGAGDVLGITVASPGDGYSASFTVDFSFVTTANTVQDIINAINSAWSTATHASTAVVTSIGPEPYQLVTDGNFEDFFLSLNGNTPIHVVFSGQTSATDIVAVINSAISTAGQSAQGTASVLNVGGLNYVSISSSVTGSNSTIALIPGNVNGPAGTNVTGIDKLGFAPGLYQGSLLAFLNGGAEITLFSPFRSPDASITISNFSGTPITKMGFSLLSNFTQLGIEPTVPPPGPNLYTIGIPEVLDFGEVPDNIETLNQRFEGPNLPVLANPLAGGSNNGKAPSLDVNGHILSIFLPKIFEFLSLTSLTLGSSNLSGSESLAPRLIIPYLNTGTSFTLIYESDAVPSVSPPSGGAFRIYETADKRYILTQNARYDGTNWNKDRTTGAAFKIEFSVNGINYSFQSIFGSVWADNAWTLTPVALAASSLISGGLALILGTGTPLQGTGPLGFMDSNLGAFSSAILNLSSSVAAQGDNFLRVMESANNLPGAPNTTILRRLNAEWTVTVGDGVISFGDFSGSNAIQQALAYWANNATLLANFLAFRIQVKVGNYQVNSVNGAINVPDGHTLYLEGISDEGCLITVTDATSPCLTVGTGVSSSSLEMKNIFLRKATTFSSVQINSGSTAIIEDCAFERIILDVENGINFYLIRCEFINVFNSFNSPTIIINAGNGATIGPFVCRDCEFATGQNGPLLLVSAVSSSSPLTYIDRITFEDCTILLNSTTATSGRLTGNCGVIDVNPNGSFANSSPTPTGVTVNLLQFNNCEVYANRSGGPISILIHLQPQANGATFTSGYLSVNRLEITGGKWIAPVLNTTYSPFMVADVGFASSEASLNTVTVGAPLGGVYLNNVTVGFDSGTTGVNMGTCTSDSTPWFTGALTDTINQADWGAFAIEASHIELTNVQMQNMSQLGGCGDWMIRWNELFIHDMTMDNYLNGGTGLSNQRIKFRSTQQGRGPYYANIRGIKMLNQITPTSSDWANDAFMFVEPNGNGYIDISECMISGFQTHTAAFSSANGIYLDDAFAGSLYTGSVSDFYDVKIHHNNIDSVGTGVSAVSGQVQVFNRVSITDNKIYNCKFRGVEWQIISPAYWDFVDVSRNTITACGNTTTVEGILIQSDQYVNGATNPRYISVNHNHCYNNNSAPTGVQIWLSITHTASSLINDFIVGTCIGNDCFYGSIFGGSIKTNVMNGSANPAAPASPTALNAFWGIRGLETGYVGGGDQIYVSTSSYIIHNAASLITP
jgi:hypothetical protein